jgi:PKD repeat protein
LTSIYGNPNKISIVLIFFLISTLIFGMFVSAESNEKLWGDTQNLSFQGNTAGNELPGDYQVQDRVITPLPGSIPSLTIPPELSSGGILTVPQNATSQGISDSCPSCGFVEKHPLMHFTSEQLDEMQNQINNAPAYSAPHTVSGDGDNLPTGSKSILSLLPYTPSERDQGYCGNCWVWASTGLLEIDHKVKTGINDRLSIQYFNSKYKNACCGGWTQTFTAWYNTDKTAIPWSNTNASYGDYNAGCGYTNVPLNTISLQPNYRIYSISTSTIETYGQAQNTAINNIKSALNANKGVEYSFFYGQNGWDAFYDFWDNSNETSVFNSTLYPSTTSAGGHAVIIVGYNDTDASNPYWIVLNSWGAPANRPNGLFRVKMNMDYSATYTSGSNTYRRYTFQTLDSTYGTVNFRADNNRGTVPLAVHFTDLSTVYSPTRWNWSFGDGATFSTTTASQRNASHTYTSPGIYSINLTITNATNSYSFVKSGYITVHIPAPGADFTGHPTSGSVPLVVSFTNLSSPGTPTGWAWFFGDETYNQVWTRVNGTSGWPIRLDHSSVVLPDSRIVLMGGSYSSGYMNDVWQSTDNGSIWTQLPNADWTAREGHSIVVIPNGSIIVMGGYDGSPRNDTWQSPDNGVTWTLMNAKAGWSARSFSTSVAMPDGSIVLMGGYDGSFRNDTWRSTDNGATWNRVNASSGWSARLRHTSVAMPDGSIVLMGGYDGNPRNDTWRSTDKGATWTRVNASSGWVTRYSLTSVSMPDSSIVLMGGYGDSYQNDVWRSVDNGTTWTRLPDAGWTGRYGHSTGLMPDGSIVILGGSAGGIKKNDVWRLMPTGSSVQNPSHTYTQPGTYKVALQSSNAGGYNSTLKTRYITVSGPTVQADTVGIYRNSKYYLRNLNSAGPANMTFNYGAPGDIALVGDWDGDGTDTVGIYRNSKFYLRNLNSAGPANLTFNYGAPGDIPLVGDWDGDGVDTVGIYRNSKYYLRNLNSAGPANLTFNYGSPGDTPLVGDWNGDGTDTVGIYRNSKYYLRNLNSAGPANLTFNYGAPGDIPLVGDWNGDGTDSVGIYRNSKYYLRNLNSAGPANLTFNYGSAGDTPLVGDWI